MKKNKPMKTAAPALAQVVQLFPKRSKEMTEARKSQRKERALGRGGICRWTYSDPNNDYAIMSDIMDCICELKDKSLSEPMKEVCRSLVAKSLFGGTQ